MSIWAVMLVFGFITAARFRELRVGGSESDLLAIAERLLWFAAILGGIGLAITLLFG